MKLEQLKKDLATTEAWLQDELERMEKTTDEHLKGILKIRCNMYERNIKELKMDIENEKGDGA